MSGIIISVSTSRSPRIEFQFSTQSSFQYNRGFNLFGPAVVIHYRRGPAAAEVTSPGVLSVIGPRREMDRWCGHFYYTAAVKEEPRQKEGQAFPYTVGPEGSGSWVASSRPWT